MPSLQLRRRVRIARLRFLDAWDVLTNRRPPLTPSRLRIAAIGGGDFAQVGEHLMKLIITAGRLQPHQRVLDVGCGIGRIAVPLTRYLTTGEYTGFDISRSAIDWCQRVLAPGHPNFSFIHVDVFNSHYNPRGLIRPTDFIFPCATDSVDVAFMGSLLTHMTPQPAAHYVQETWRVLKRGGRAVITFFLLDESVSERSLKGNLEPSFRTYPESWWAIQDANDPEAAVGYDVKVVTQTLEAIGFHIEDIDRGAWSGHGGSLTYQDVVVVSKPPKA